MYTCDFVDCFASVECIQRACLKMLLLVSLTFEHLDMLIIDCFDLAVFAVDCVVSRAVN